MLLHILRKLKYVKYVFHNQNEELLGEAGPGEATGCRDLIFLKIKLKNFRC